MVTLDQYEDAVRAARKWAWYVVAAFALNSLALYAAFLLFWKPLVQPFLETTAWWILQQGIGVEATKFVLVCLALPAYLALFWPLIVAHRLIERCNRRDWRVCWSPFRAMTHMLWGYTL